MGHFSLFCRLNVDLGPAPADGKLDANTGIVNKSKIAQSTDMSAKKLAQQKAGPLSPASEEIKADSIGLRNLKGTVKATLETLRRIQRQTAKAFSLLGTASITGMGIAGLLLAPFPVPTADDQVVVQPEGNGNDEEGEQDDEKKLPNVPVVKITSVGIDVYGAQWPTAGQTAELGMSVGHDNPPYSSDTYFFSGPTGGVGTPYELCWTEIHLENDWYDAFLCGDTCLSETLGFNVYMCQVVRYGDGQRYGGISVATVVYFEGATVAYVGDSNEETYTVPVEVTFHP